MIFKDAAGRQKPDVKCDGCKLFVKTSATAIRRWFPDNVRLSSVKVSSTQTQRMMLSGHEESLSTELITSKSGEKLECRE